MHLSKYVPQYTDTITVGIFTANYGEVSAGDL